MTTEDLSVFLTYFVQQLILYYGFNPLQMKFLNKFNLS